MFQRAALATLGLLWLVVVTGGLVRLTASGLGCPHWPTCQADSLIPSTGYHSIVEFSNRVISGIAMVAAVVTAWLGFRTPGLGRRERGSLAQRLSLAGIVLTICQLGVGEYQYRNGLPWEVIAVHVAIAGTLVITVVTVACLVAYRRLR